MGVHLSRALVRAAARIVNVVVADTGYIADRRCRLNRAGPLARIGGLIRESTMPRSSRGGRGQLRHAALPSRGTTQYAREIGGCRNKRNYQH
jgi:hypothetical protein